jgi:hypothetical protein
LPVALAVVTLAGPGWLTQPLLSRRAAGVTVGDLPVGKVPVPARGRGGLGAA